MFKSYKEYYEAIETLLNDLDSCGNTKDAEEIREGFKCINGLTDGWAHFLEPLLKIEENREERLTDYQLSLLNEICDATYFSVYRSKRIRLFYSIRQKLKKLFS